MDQIKLANIMGLFGPSHTIASATTTNLPGDKHKFTISGSATITSLTKAEANRIVLFLGAASAAVVFTNTNDTSTAGQMDLGGSDITLGATDFLVLLGRSDGSWLRIFSTNN